MLYLYLDIEVYFCLPALGRFFLCIKKKTRLEVFLFEFRNQAIQTIVKVLF